MLIKADAPVAISKPSKKLHLFDIRSLTAANKSQLDINLRSNASIIRILTPQLAILLQNIRSSHQLIAVGFPADSLNIDALPEQLLPLPQFQPGPAGGFIDT